MLSTKKIERISSIGRNMQNRWNNEIAFQNFEDTDEALKLYNRTHPDENLNLTEPVFF